MLRTVDFPTPLAPVINSNTSRTFANDELSEAGDAPVVHRPANSTTRPRSSPRMRTSWANLGSTVLRGECYAKGVALAPIRFGAWHLGRWVGSPGGSATSSGTAAWDTSG